MDPIVNFVIVIAIMAAVFLLLIKGVVRTFQRNPIVAILVLIFLFPIYLIRAFIELFLEKPQKIQKVIIVERTDN